jgi:hypothetical protein
MLPVVWGRLECRGDALKECMRSSLNTCTNGGKQYLVGIVGKHLARDAVAVPWKLLGRPAAIGWLVELAALP